MLPARLQNVKRDSLFGVCHLIEQAKHLGEDLRLCADFEAAGAGTPGRVAAERVP